MILARLSVRFDIKEWHDSEKGIVSDQSVQWWQDNEGEALNFGEYRDNFERCQGEAGKRRLFEL